MRLVAKNLLLKGVAPDLVASEIAGLEEVGDISP